VVPFPPPAPATSARPSRATVPSASSCAYGLAAPEVSLTPDLADPAQSDVAWAAGRLLVVYGVTGSDGDAVLARLYDLGAGSLSAPMRVATRGLVFAPHVASIGGRFLVTWQRDAPPGTPGGKGTYARWVSATGELSPEPGGTIGQYEGAIFTATQFEGYYAITWNDGSLRRLVVGPELTSLHGVTHLLAGGLSRADRFAEAPDPRGGIWVALAGSREKGARGNLRLLLYGYSSPTGVATEVPGADGVYDRSPTFLTAPDGLLLAWNRRDPAGERAEGSGVWIQHLDARGGPREAPRQIPEARGSHAVVQLLPTPRGPMLVWGEKAHAMALSWEGVPVAPPTTLAPLAPPGAEPKWLATDGDPWLVLTATRHAHPERFAARVRCGGEVP
jgi:hypothetical protein